MFESIAEANKTYNMDEALITSLSTTTINGESR